MLSELTYFNDSFGHEIRCSTTQLEENSLTAKQLTKILMQPSYIFLEKNGGLHFVRLVGRRRNILVHVVKENEFHRVRSIVLNPSKEFILELLKKAELQVFSW